MWSFSCYCNWQQCVKSLMLQVPVKSFNRTFRNSLDSTLQSLETLLIILGTLFTYSKLTHMKVRRRIKSSSIRQNWRGTLTSFSALILIVLPPFLVCLFGYNCKASKRLPILGYVARIQPMAHWSNRKSNSKNKMIYVKRFVHWKKGEAL